MGPLRLPGAPGVRCSAEVQAQMSEADWARVHVLGRLEREAFTRLLQVSRVHVYLSDPFVLSWSLLEAMSVGAAARAFAQSRYDLGRVCLPQQLAWVQSLSAGL